MGYTHAIMEQTDEAKRLDLKTEGGPVFRQALWAGIQPGMRVADIGSGSGKTTRFLHQLIQPGGEIVGIDPSRAQVRHAEKSYGGKGISFTCRDFYRPLQDLAGFDFIWVRFVLEYHRSRGPEVVANLAQALNPGGILCLADLDNNCLNHYGLPSRLEETLKGIMDTLEADHDFDPYAGRKLYSYLYDQGFEDIAVALEHHHLIYGPLNDIDRYNWTQKIEVAAKNSGFCLDAYPGGFREFAAEFATCFADPRRFSYTPIIYCKGRKTRVS